MFLEHGVVAAVLVGASDAPFEGEWDEGHPEELVARLRERFGAITRVALAAGLGMLHVKPVQLPDVSIAERRRILSLEPDRFFPVPENGRYVVGLSSESSLAFLTAAAPLERIASAFASWAPVDRIDAAPVAAARACGATAQIGIPDGRIGAATLEVVNGRVSSVRRSTRGAIECTALEIARGAAMGLDLSLDDALMPEPIMRAVLRRRTGRVVTAGVTALFALVFALWAVDRSRERLLQRVNAAIAADSSRAAPALALVDSLGASARERAAVAEVTGARVNVVAVLATLSSLLPPGVVLQKVETQGRDWRIEGTARAGANIVALLDRSGTFEDVRTLGASSRYIDAGRPVETFAVAFRAR